MLGTNDLKAMAFDLILQRDSVQKRLDATLRQIGTLQAEDLKKKRDAEKKEKKVKK